MKIAGTIMLVLGILLLIRIIQFKMGIIWGLPIPITGVALLILGYTYDKGDSK